ncbi:hypothetical protein BH10BDE1_BH10BDE1_07670 [soil metagenome]
MILRFAKEQTQAARDEKFREFCDITSQALNRSIENAKVKEVAEPGDFLLVGTHTDPTLELDLDTEEPIRLDGFECIYVPRAEADARELRLSDEFKKRFGTNAVDKNYAGLRVNEFLMSQVVDGPTTGLKDAKFQDRYHFVVKIIGS